MGIATLATIAAWTAVAGAIPLDSAATGASFDGTLALLPVGLEQREAGYTLDAWLRNDANYPIELSISAMRCLRGSVSVPVELHDLSAPGPTWATDPSAQQASDAIIETKTPDPAPRGIPPPIGAYDLETIDLSGAGRWWPPAGAWTDEPSPAHRLPLVPGEATRLRLWCPHGPGVSGPFGLAVAEVVAHPPQGDPQLVLSELVWRLHEAAVGRAASAEVEPVWLSYRRPAAVAGTLGRLRGPGTLDGVLTVEPVALRVHSRGYRLDLWVRNDGDQLLRIPLDTVQCRGTDEGRTSVVGGADGGVVTLDPGEARPLRLRCATGRAGVPRGIEVGAVRADQGPVLTDIVWELPEREGAHALVHFRRPPRRALSLQPPDPVRIDVPVGDPDALHALGFVAGGDESARFAAGRFTPGPGSGNWRLAPHAGPAADVWFDAAPKGWAVEARLRVIPVGEGSSCVGLWIHDVDAAHEVRFEPGAVLLDGHRVTAETEGFATWRIESTTRALVLSRDGVEVLRIPRHGKVHGRELLSFGQICYGMGSGSEWEALTLEVGFGEPRWRPRGAWPDAEL